MFKRFFAVLIAVIISLGVWVIPSSAAEDFYWKTLDKAYVTFMFDDGNMPFTRDCYQIFSSYGLPMTCAVIAKYTDPENSNYNKELVDALHDIQDAGGEILSHGYNHIPVTSKERAENPVVNTAGDSVYDEEGIDYEFRKSYQVLTKNGFKVGGIIQVGAGGDEGTADYDLVDKVVRRYYKYSDAYGAKTSTQYKAGGRSFLTTFTQTKMAIDNAIKNKKWITISAHNFGDSSGNINSEALRSTLDYIIANNVEVVTWSEMYEKFGVYSGPEIPTVDLDLTPYEDKTSSEEASSNTTSSKTNSGTSSKDSNKVSSNTTTSHTTTVTSQPTQSTAPSGTASQTVSTASSQPTAVKFPSDKPAKEYKDITSVKTILIVGGAAVGALILANVILVVWITVKKKKAAVSTNIDTMPSNDNG